MAEAVAQVHVATIPAAMAVARALISFLGVCCIRSESDVLGVRRWGLMQPIFFLQGSGWWKSWGKDHQENGDQVVIFILVGKCPINPPNLEYPLMLLWICLRTETGDTPSPACSGVCRMSEVCGAEAEFISSAGSEACKPASGTQSLVGGGRNGGPPLWVTQLRWDGSKEMGGREAGTPGPENPLH